VISDPVSKKVHVFVKGAPEVVLEYCGHIMDRSGTKTDLTEEKKQYLIKNIVTDTFAK
jgi:magnesium-transporting ATPase (P-type)